jgi:hypothetical protein
VLAIEYESSGRPSFDQKVDTKIDQIVKAVQNNKVSEEKVTLTIYRAHGKGSYAWEQWTV